MSVLRAVLQRFPSFLHITIAVFAIYGERLAPLVFTCFIWLMHVALLNANLRSIYGLFAARRGVVQCATTDWKAEWAKSENPEKLEYDDVLHVVIIPNYMEDIETLRQTLDVLASHPMAATSYVPVLGMELREASASLKALQLVSEFAPSFKDIRYTLHPPDIPGETAGKGSNLAWAARSVWMAMRPAGALSRSAGRTRELDGNAEDYLDEKVELARGPARDDRERTVITVMDSDTNFAADYFAAISCKFATANAATRRLQMFVPPICFDRNAHEVPVGVRVTDIFWAIGGMSTMYEGSSAKVPTSAYSISLELAESVGGWDPDCFAIGEDMHMFLKCAISTKGHVVSETIYSPASQLDVMGNVRGGVRGFVGDYVARYKQALRHLWGSLDIAYTLHRVLTGDLRRHPDGPQSQQVGDFKPAARRYGKILGGRGDDLFVNEFDEDELALSDASRISSPELFVDRFTQDICLPPILEEPEEQTEVKQALLVDRPRKEGMAMLPLFTMLYRIYEACLMMGNITAFVLARAAVTLYMQYKGISTAVGSLEVIPDVNVQHALFWAEKMRNMSGILLVVTALSYDAYHRYTAKHRWENDVKGRLGVPPRERSHRNFYSLLDYFALPISIAFGPIAMLHAHFAHIFTNRLTYTVSFKLVKPNIKSDSYIKMESDKRFGNPLV